MVHARWVILNGMTQQHGTVAVIGNPTSDKGRGAKIDAQVIELLERAGEVHGFGVIDLTGTSFDDSLNRARAEADRYDHLVVVGGDGMIALGANAVGNSGKPLGIVAIGSGNDFARGLRLPIDRVEVAVEGIVGAIVRGSHIDVDMGHVVSLPGGRAVEPSTGAEIDAVEHPEAPIDRYYAGMLSCGLDASINDRANHSRLPSGTLRYLSAVLVELTRLKSYGYHVRVTPVDGEVEEMDIVTPLLTVANSRHIGGGIQVSPYSLFADGQLDLIWINHMPNLPECAQAVSRAYGDRLLGCRIFSWRRIREIEITRASEGADPPVLMADGEYVGHEPVRVTACDRALRVLVPPAVAAAEARRTDRDVEAMLRRDGRDPATGAFARD